MQSYFIPAFDDEITFFPRRDSNSVAQKLRTINIKFRKKKPYRTELTHPSDTSLGASQLGCTCPLGPHFNRRGANKSAKMINVIFVPHKLT